MTIICSFDDMLMRLAALIAGSYISKRFGRTMTMSVAGMAFLVGTPLAVFSTSHLPYF